MQNNHEEFLMYNFYFYIFIKFVLRNFLVTANCYLQSVMNYDVLYLRYNKFALR